MDKPLGALQAIVLGIALLTVGLYVVWVTTSDGPPIPLADCLRTMHQTECIREDRAVLQRSIKADEEIYARLSDGQLSLAEAADALREEVESRPAHLRQPILPHERTVPRGQLYMLRLLARVGEGPFDDPHRSEVVRRLRAEMQACQAAHARPSPTDTTHTSAVIAAH